MTQPLPQMTLERAVRIQQLRTGIPRYTFRALATKICEEYPEYDQELTDNQIFGSELCAEALRILYNVERLDKIRHTIRDIWDR